MGEIFRPNSQYVRDTLSDGTVVLDFNNKIVLLSGKKLGEEVIHGVVAISATSETYGNYIKEVVYDEIENYRYNGKTIKHLFITLQRVSEDDDIRFYDADDYHYNQSQYDSGERATLPDDWQNYGYTAGKQNGRGVSGKATSGVSEHSIISKKKTRNSYSEVDLWSPDLFDVEEEKVSEYLEGYIDTAGKMLEQSGDAILEDGTVRKIANNVFGQKQKIQRLQLRVVETVLPRWNRTSSLYLIKIYPIPPKLSSKICYDISY